MPTPKQGYYLKAGARVPSVTTILGRFKDSASLIHWAWEQGSKGVDYRQLRDAAAGVGTVAHAMVEGFIDGKSAAECYQIARTLPPEGEARAVSSFNAYKQWQSNFQVNIVSQEIQLVSEQHRYGGTPDAVGMIGNQLVLLDWKTSNGIYTDYLVQLAAYKNLWEENFPERPLTGGFHLLRFAKEHGDFTHHYFAGLDNAWRQFLLFREAYEIDKELKKRT
jgi:hypothetical protein